MGVDATRPARVRNWNVAERHPADALRGSRSPPDPQCDACGQNARTHVFVNGDRYLDSDAVFGVKDSLIADFVRHEAGKAPDGHILDVPYFTMAYDFVLRKGA
ncbi:hypothetical protein JQ624_03780 [Bradyrhizobium sp. AUGA SZCCT0283]|nr:hypothetical protein [Bradyrhizobium sp. AUGA SZCCT0283]